jgi:hypothetical protein
MFRISKLNSKERKILTNIFKTLFKSLVNPAQLVAIGTFYGEGEVQNIDSLLLHI